MIRGEVSKGGVLMDRSAIDISYYIVNYCNEHNIPISNLKLQKLLYYVQAAFLVRGKEAFSDEIRPWRYGPVVEAVYQEFKIYVNKNIETTVSDIRLADDEKTIINEVIESYKSYSPSRMIGKTHNEDPWKNAYRNEDEVIQKETIRNYYGRHRGYLYGKSE